MRSIAGGSDARPRRPAAAQKRGGTLTVGVELDIPGFDPLKVGVFDTAANIAADLIFDTLTSLDDNGKPSATAGRVVVDREDFKTWTFKLRPDVKFQDGTPFNAQAVAWNYRAPEGSQEPLPLRLLHRQHPTASRPRTT